jgi:hypothetical protein
MYPETMFAAARIAEMKRKLSAPMLLRQHEANERRAETRRSRRRQLLARARRLLRKQSIGRRRRIAAIS